MIPIVSTLVSSDDSRFMENGRPYGSANALGGPPNSHSYIGIGGGMTLLQITPGIDCMIALLVGLAGGMLAGMTLTRARTSDEPSGASKPRSRVPVSTSQNDRPELSTRAFDDGPSLTDEERIIRLLASNDGRMKQSQIVGATDWSKAKVSRLLSAMEANEEITKLTVGRENIIFLGEMDGLYASGGGSDE